MNEILLVLLSGGTGAVVAVAGDIIINRLNRRDKKADQAQATDDALHKKVDAIATGVMYLELDKIKSLGMHYIAEREIDYDDRRLLHEFHTAAAAAKQDIESTGTAQVNAVNAAGQEQMTAVNNVGAAQKSAVEVAGAEQVNAVYAAGAEVQLTAKSLVINDIDNNKQYTASIRVKDGKPILIYDELTT